VEQRQFSYSSVQPLDPAVCEKASGGGSKPSGCLILMENAWGLMTLGGADLQFIPIAPVQRQRFTSGNFAPEDHRW
jgi:hypothetical protein